MSDFIGNFKTIDKAIEGYDHSNTLIYKEKKDLTDVVE